MSSTAKWILLAAGAFVQALEERQGLIIGSPEEAAFRRGFINAEGFHGTIAALPASPYRSYLERLLLDMTS